MVNQGGSLLKSYICAALMLLCAQISNAANVYAYRGDGSAVQFGQQVDVTSNPSAVEWTNGNASAVFYMKPLPAIRTTVYASTPEEVWSPLSEVYTSFLYGYEVHGAANTVVKVGFAGNFELAQSSPDPSLFTQVGYDENGLEQRSVAGNWATATIAVSGNGQAPIYNIFGLANYPTSFCDGLPTGGNGSSVSFGQYSHGYASPDPSFSYSLTTPLGAYEYNTLSVSGLFSGSILLALNEDGYGYGSVLIGANAYVQSSAYVDPYLFIDPDYLAAHPDASLTTESGIGNVPSVPEPESVALVLSGMLALFGMPAMRRMQLKRA